MAKDIVLITGISGFLGQYLEPALVKAGYDVHGMYEHKTSFAKNKHIPTGNKHLANLTDFAAVEKLIKKLQPNFVLHLAAKTEVAFSFDNYKEVSDVNYVGTVALAEANRRFNPNLKLFVMASTMETYGHQRPEDGAFTEDTPQYPMAPYAVAKLGCEKYLEYMEYAYNFPFTIFRQTNAYGRTDNDFFVVETIITQMLKGESIDLGESTVRNFIWIDDLVDLYKTVLEKHKETQGEIFCTGPDNGLEISDLVTMIAKKLDWHGKVNWGVRPKRPGEIYYLNSTADKARQVLGWEPKVSLSEGLDKTIDIWKHKLVK